MYFVNICIHRLHRKSVSWYFKDISLNLVIQLSSKKRAPAGLECWNNSSSELPQCILFTGKPEKDKELEQK